MNGFDVWEWVRLAQRRRTIIIEVASIIMVVVVAATFLWPPVYRSTAEILVQDNRAQLLVSPAIDNNSPNQPAAVANTVTEEDLNSERELLTSNYLIEQALAGLPAPSAAGLGSAVGFMSTAASLPSLLYRFIHGAPAETAREHWARQVARNFGSSVIKRSNVIEIGFSSNDARWCHDFLTRLLDKYMEFHSNLSNDPQAEEFFQKQAQLLQTRLQAAEDQLRGYELQTGITNLAEQKQALITQISGLQTESAKTAAQLAAAERRATVLQVLANKTPRRIGKETRTVQNMALTQLKPQVLQLEAERADLLTRYQPNSQRIQEIDAKLEAAQKIVNREDHLEVQEQSTDLNPVRVQVDTELEQSTANAAALKADETAMAAQIQQAQDQLKQLVNGGVEADRLQRTVDAEKQAYLSYLRRGEEARAAKMLNRSKILNVAVAQPPTLPQRPYSPIVPIDLAVGFLIALGCGLAAAYLVEQLDPRIYNAASVASASGFNTIAQLRELGQE
ncbi:MAG TPA: Wzz/FepE/Etk N-terminal domain-containing protein [Candidatus Binataceae bacterium]|nr:Wzz/FepE/Etk N-terminal domain-containing protein [Candidatus Binataceae bacterium]